jgi:hypothetical protein
MEQMKKDSLEAFAWVEQLAPNTWVRAFFSEFPKCDLLLNNNCEVFNKLPLNHMSLRAAPFPSQLAATSFPYPIRYTSTIERTAAAPRNEQWGKYFKFAEAKKDSKQ